MDRPERGLRPLPSGSGPGGGDKEGDARDDEALLARLRDAPAPERIPEAWLALQCRLIRGCRRGVLLLGAADRGPFSVAASWPSGQDAARHLLAAAERALVERMGFVLPPPAPSEGEPAPLEGVLIAEPVRLAGALLGAVVLEVGPRSDSELQALRFQVCLGFGWLDASVHRGRAEAEKIGKSRLEVALGLLAASLEHDRFQGGATALATELSSELGCDRVSLGFLHRSRVRVEALSHNAQFGERTNLIRSIEGAMEEAIDQQATVVFPAHDGETPRAHHAHAELARQFGAEGICTVPLLRGDRLCGALTLERQMPFDPATQGLVEVVAALAGPALEGLRLEDRFIGRKVADALRGVLEDLLGPDHVALKLGAVLVGAVLLVLTLVSGEFRVTADTTVEPAVKRAAVAPFDGYIAEAPVRVGDTVRAGTTLGALDVRDLKLEQAKWISQYEQTLKQYRQALAERDAAQVEIQAAGVQEARAELDLIQDRLSRAELRAPFDGVIVTGDLTQRLGAPVKRGEVLFETAPLNAYRLYLKVRENDIEAVEVGQKGRLVLASLPQETFAFTVAKITPVATAQEGRTTFRVEAPLDDPDGRLRPGMEGVAKIDAGRRGLLWIWTHDAANWMRLKLWSWSR